MPPNYHTPWADVVGVSGTHYTAAEMNPALADLDKTITYHKGAFVSCDGVLSWAAGTLTWSGKIHIYFNRTDGQAIHNEVAAGNIALSDGEFCYIDLSETNNQVVTIQKAAIGTGAASNYIAYNRFLLGFRNTADDAFYPEEFAGVFAQMLAGGAYVEKATFDAQSILAAVTDNTPVAVTVAEQRIVGRKTGGNIAALTGAEVAAIVNGMPAGQQAITCADNVTIDWSLGATAYMTFDRDSVALTFSNPVAGTVYRLLLTQSGGGSDALSWSTTIKWRGGSAPTLTATGGAVDILTFVYINSVWYGDIAANFA
jgi:hypothetical protein